ncbi:MAG: hypothetical protein AAFO07_02925 [Bacteroidota bacterium]
MDLGALRRELKDFLDFKVSTDLVEFEIIERQEEGSYQRQLVRYLGSEQDEIRAYLFVPKEKPIIGAVLVHHQHNGERHLGKSEVAGLAGDPHQFFCPALAAEGIITLAPDSICFEDRRTNQQGIEPASDPDDDWLQHYNEMCYRLLDGKTLMKKVIDDSSIGISILSQQEDFPKENIGILGHSYGGNTVIFHSPFDERIRLSCSSGAVCSYKTKFRYQTGIEMAEVIPGFKEKYDIEDLLKAICPRKLLIVSAEEDKYSRDAKGTYTSIKKTYKEAGVEDALMLNHFEGGHALDKTRFESIVEWFVSEFKKVIL